MDCRKCVDKAAAVERNVDVEIKSFDSPNELKAAVSVLKNFQRFPFDY